MWRRQAHFCRNRERVQKFITYGAGLSVVGLRPVVSAAAASVVACIAAAAFAGTGSVVAAVAYAEGLDAACGGAACVAAAACAAAEYTVAEYAVAASVAVDSADAALAGVLKTAAPGKQTLDTASKGYPPSAGVSCGLAAARCG